MLPISWTGDQNAGSNGDGPVSDTGLQNVTSGTVRRGEEMGGAVAGCMAKSGRRATGGVRVPAECGDLPFVIKRDGTWLYRGTPILRKELVCLFSSVLRREADASWWLQTPAERGRIEVEDAPFVAVEMDWTGEGRDQVLSFRTNVDEMITAGPQHPIRISHDILTCEPTPYLLVRPGEGQFSIEARINRATYYELVALAEPRWIGCRQVLGVWSQGQFFSLGDMPPAEA
jgi:uncharacterized protein